jgi:hypothetical protein
MKTTQRSQENAERMLPLLRAIGQEVRERNLAIHALETRIADLTLAPRLHAQEIAQLESELSTHRRELRGIEREMERLGCSFDQDDPNRIVVPGTAVSLAFGHSLSDTHFFQLGGVC